MKEERAERAHRTRRRYAEREQKMPNGKKLLANHWYRFNDNGEIHIGLFVGRQSGFECCVCGKGCNAFTFNIHHSTHDQDYETWGYGKEHLPKILEDIGENDYKTVFVDE